MNSGINPPAELSTPRLFLRKPTPGDAGPLFHAYTSDPCVVQFVNWPAHDSEEDTRAYLRCCLEEWTNEAGYPYIIEIADEPSGPIGMIHLHRQPSGVSFGYVMAHAYWGRGYMTEALSNLVDWSLAQPGIWRASAVCDIDNLASARVMEKAGMAFEGILRRYLVHSNLSPEPRDCRLYAKVRP